MRNIFDYDKALIDVRSVFLKAIIVLNFKENVKITKISSSKDRVRAVYLAMKNHSLNQIVKFLIDQEAQSENGLEHIIIKD